MPEDGIKNSSSGINSLPEEDPRDMEVKVLFSDGSDKPSSGGNNPVVLSFGDSEEKESPRKPKTLFEGNVPASDEGIHPAVLSFKEVTGVVVENLPDKAPSVLKFGDRPACDPAPVKKEMDVAIILKDAKVRKRIEVSIEELRKIEPSVQEDKVLKKAQDIIRAFNFEDNRDGKFEEFGTESQQGYALEIKDIFELAKDGCMETVKNGISEIVGLIKEIDLGCLIEEPKDEGFLASIFGAKPKRDRKTVEADFEKQHKLIEDKIAAINEKLPQLIRIKQRFDSFADRIPDMVDEFDSKTVAGKFLLGYGQNLLLAYKASDEPEKRNEAMRLETVILLFERRMESLAITKISLLQGIDQVRLLRTTVLNLESAIQNTLLVMVPLWWNSCLNIFLVLGSKGSTGGAQEVKNLLELQNQIVEKLKV